jgi:arylsulfatase A-like enzyme/Flp pilus assembly protein TadD
MGGLVTAAGSWRGGRGEVRREAGMDVLLVTVDTLRADAVGAYGLRDGASATPFLDRLAARGVRFQQAHAHNVVTLPSHSNILSGHLPYEHGVRDNAGFRFPTDVPTLATLLKARGYRTGAFVSAFTLDSRFGLDRGFDTYDDHFADGATPAAFVLPERAGSDTVQLAHDWLAARDDRPSFAWVHLYDPHAPYRPPEPYARAFPGQPYLGEVAAADAALERLLGPVLDGRHGRDTLVIVTADHGESLGEHGESTHGIFAYEATLHVPLVLYGPVLHPRVVSTPARHVDIVPTVLDALSLPVPEGLPGRSLLGDAAGLVGPASPTYFEALSGSTNRGWAPLYGVLREGRKYIELPLPELYALDADPREERNVVSSETTARESLQETLASLRAHDRGLHRTTETAETREHLRALGYLAAGAAPEKRTYTQDDDPKRLIELDSLLEQVIAHHRRGEVEEALSLCLEVVRRRPDMPAALVQQALLQRALGRLPPAVEALRRVVVLTPEDLGAVALLASYLNESGGAEEAARLVAPYASREDAPLDLLVAQGVSLAQIGRRDEALVAFARARRADPSNPMVLVQIATVHLLSGRDAAAEEALREALVLSPDMSLAHHTLGLLAARRGDDQAALARWRRALELNPNEHDALLKLGSLLVRLGRPAEARPLFERFARDAPRPLYDRERTRVLTWLRQPSPRVHGTGGPS